MSKNYDIQIQATKLKLKKLQAHLAYLEALQQVNEEKSTHTPSGEEEGK